MVGQKVSDLYAELSLEDKNYLSGMANAEKVGKNSTKKIGMDIFSMAGIAKVSFAAIGIAGVKAFGDIAVSSVKLQSSINELDNVLNKTFGKSADVLRLQADTMAQAMGRSRLEMRQMISDAGALGKGLGFTGVALEDMSRILAQTAVDMGSFFNIADSEAFTALRSGLVGETEAIKRFGIVMTVANLNAFALEQGIKKTVETMSEAEKTQLRYNFILEKTAFFAGDARDTIGSTANQLKKLSAGFTNLKTNIGYLLDGSTNIVLQKVNAQIEKMVAALDKLVVKGKELDDSFKNSLFKEKEAFKIKLGTDETFEKFNKFLKTYKDSLSRLGIDASKIGNEFSELYLTKARGQVGGENVLDKYIIKIVLIYP